MHPIHIPLFSPTPCVQYSSITPALWHSHSYSLSRALRPKSLSITIYLGTATTDFSATTALLLALITLSRDYCSTSWVRTVLVRGSEVGYTCDIALNQHDGFESVIIGQWSFRIRGLRWLCACTKQCDTFSDLACVWKISGSVHWWNLGWSMTFEQILNVENSHPNFAMIYIDHDVKGLLGPPRNLWFGVSERSKNLTCHLPAQQRFLYLLQDGKYQPTGHGPWLKKADIGLM